MKVMGREMTHGGNSAARGSRQAPPAETTRNRVTFNRVTFAARNTPPGLLAAIRPRSPLGKTDWMHFFSWTAPL